MSLEILLFYVFVHLPQDIPRTLGRMDNPCPAPPEEALDELTKGRPDIGEDIQKLHKRAETVIIRKKARPGRFS